MSYIGESVIRVDTPAKVTGEANYPGDINMPDQAYMKILFSERPHAIITEIDTEEAEALEGVILVLTAKDVPNNEYGQIYNDQPVLCGPGSNKAYADRVRFIGDQVACVIAETEEIANRARKLIKVTYQDLPIIESIEAALADGATLLHPERKTNIINQVKVRHGNIEEAFEKADVIIESEYFTPAQEHAFLQPEAGLGYMDDEGRVTVVVSGQWVHEEQKEIAHALGLPEDQVRVIYPAIGGAFGGREDVSVQIVLGLAAWRLAQKGIHRPVKIIWSREESIIGHGKRHPFKIKSRWGATKEGKVIAAEVNLIADGGAYAYTSPTVLGNAIIMSTSPYEIPNVNVDACSVYTNNIPNGAFRGFGGPQGAFAAESQMNKLAEALKIDPMEIRMRNVVKDGSILNVGTAMPDGVTMAETYEAAAKAGGWEQGPNGWYRPDGYSWEVPGKPHLRRGIAITGALKNVGFSFGFPEECWATIELHGKENIEKAILKHAGADVGQSIHTAMIQMTAHALDLPMEKIELIASDTATSLNSGSASASRLALMSGNSIIGAAKLALEKWHDEERPAVATYQYKPPKTTPFDPETGKSFPNFAYGYAATVVELETDIDTGEIRLINVICADDVGRAINPREVEGQIEGCIVQVAGHTILENFVQEKGQTLTRTLSTYLIPTVLDIPENVESVILEYPDPIGPWGVRGMGEMPFLPFAAAVTGAMHAATGHWMNYYPLTPENVLRQMGKLED
jgi:CO/xanthine dehydrogenase Mo-binding subunit